MIPKIIHTVWLGDGRPPMWGPDTDFWEWNVYRDFSDDAISKGLGINESQFLGSNHAITSNMLRLHALYRHGGIYLDTDVEVLKDLSPLLEYDEFIARQPDGVFCNAIMGAKPGSPWIKRQIELLQDFKNHDAAHACHIIEQAPSENLTVAPTEWFYPWNWDEKPDRSRITDQTMCVHHWEGSWLK